MVGACHTLECGHLGVSQGKILSLIVEIAVGLRRLQLDCGDCSWIAEIAVGLQRLQLDCGDCSPRDAVGLTNCICKLRNFCSLIVEIAVGLWRLQSKC